MVHSLSLVDHCADPDHRPDALAHAGMVRDRYSVNVAAAFALRRCRLRHLFCFRMDEPAALELLSDTHGNASLRKPLPGSVLRCFLASLASRCFSAMRWRKVGKSSMGKRAAISSGADRPASMSSTEAGAATRGDRPQPNRISANMGSKRITLACRCLCPSLAPATPLGIFPVAGAQKAAGFRANVALMFWRMG